MRFRTLAGLALVMLVVGLPAAAQEIFQGNEFRLEGTGGTRTRIPTVGFHDTGAFVVAWEDEIDGITGRFFGRDTRALSNNVVLVTNDSVRPFPFHGIIDTHEEPAIAFGPDRRFLLFWTWEVERVSIDIFFESRDVLDRDVYGQLFDFGGRPAGAPFPVNTSTAGFQNRPSAARFPNGDVLVVWQSEEEVGFGQTDSLGVFGRRFDAEGNPLGDEFRIDVGAGDTDAARPAVAALPSGRALVVWEGCCDAGDDLGIFGRLLDFSPGAGPWPAPFLINSTVEGNQRVPVAAGDDQSGFLVAWQGPTGEFEGQREIFRVYARKVGLQGGLRGEEGISSGDLGWGHSSPVVAVGARGEVLLAWMTWDGPFRIGVFGTRLAMDTRGVAPVEQEFEISQHVIGGQFRIAASTTPTGRFLVAWEGFDDDDELGINARLVLPAPLRQPCTSGFSALAASTAGACPP